MLAQPTLKCFEETLGAWLMLGVVGSNLTPSNLTLEPGGARVILLPVILLQSLAVLG